MESFFEKSDVLNAPVEAMIFNAANEEFPVKSHWHYFMEIIYVLSGEIEYRAGESGGEVHAGELVLFYPKQVHSIDSCGDLPVYALLKFDVSRLRGSGDYSPKFSQIFRQAENSANIFPVLTAEKCERIGARGLITDCVSEVGTHEYGYGTALDAALHILLTRIVRLWISEGFSVEDTGTAIDSEPIYSITEYIDTHSQENISVSELAAMCRMSYSHFARRFREIYRQSCKQFINALRVSKAADYLIFTDRDLNFISQETGFSDCSHFIRVFKEAKGVTPKKYRDIHRG